VPEVEDDPFTQTHSQQPNQTNKLEGIQQVEQVKEDDPFKDTYKQDPFGNTFKTEKSEKTDPFKETKKEVTPFDETTKDVFQEDV